MADKKLTQLTELNAVTNDDLLYIVDGTTGVSHKVAVSTLLDGVEVSKLVASDGSPDPALSASADGVITAAVGVLSPYLAAGTADNYNLTISGAARGGAFMGINTSSATNGDILNFCATNSITGELYGFLYSTTTTGEFTNRFTQYGAGPCKLEMLTYAGYSDPKLVLTIAGAVNWCVGVDNSDGDKFKISASDDPGSTTHLTIDTLGATQLGGDLTIGTSPNQIVLSPSTHGIKLSGTATTFDDLRVEPVARTTGANAPSFEVFRNGVRLYTFDNATAGSEKEIFFTVQLPHAWKEGSTIYPHVHWVPKTAGNAGEVIRVGLEYTKAKPGATFGATTTIYGNTLAPVGVITTANDHCITPIGSGITMTGDTLSTLLVCRLFRDSANAADTYGGSAGILYVDFHYEVDSFGSSEEYTK